MGYPILRNIQYSIVWVMLLLKNILYHKNVPSMIKQSLGSTGYLTLFYNPIAPVSYTHLTLPTIYSV